MRKYLLGPYPGERSVVRSLILDYPDFIDALWYLGFESDITL
jgi:hypothetical protein